MAKRLTFLTLLVLLSGYIGCRSGSDELTPKRFVQFYADVAIAQESAFDSAAAVDSAFAIAERTGISADQLARFRDRIHADPVLWVEIWEMVVEEIQSRKDMNSE